MCNLFPSSCDIFLVISFNVAVRALKCRFCPCGLSAGQSLAILSIGDTDPPCAPTEARR